MWLNGWHRIWKAVAAYYKDLSWHELSACSYLIQTKGQPSFQQICAGFASVCLLSASVLGIKSSMPFIVIRPVWSNMPCQGVVLEGFQGSVRWRHGWSDVTLVMFVFWTWGWCRDLWLFLLPDASMALWKDQMSYIWLMHLKQWCEEHLSCGDVSQV